MSYVREMPNGSESVEFSCLPVRIRELIKHLWETNPEICSPFGSTSDQIGQVSLVDQRVPDDSEDHESLEAERTGNQAESENENSAASGVNYQPNGLEIVVYENPAERQLVVYEGNGNHTPAGEIDAAPDSDYDSSRTLGHRLAELRNRRRCRHEENVDKAAKNKNNPKKTPKFSERQKHRMLSDVLLELKDEYVETPDEYVEVSDEDVEISDEDMEIPFPNDFVDDITQISSRKQKAEKANLNKNKNKKTYKACKTKESPRFGEAGPSSHGVVNHTGSTEPCGSGSVVGRLSMAKPLNQGHPTRSRTPRSRRPSGSWLAMGRVERAKPLKCGPKRLNSDNDINDPRVNEVAGILVSLGEEMTQTRGCKGIGECDGCEPSGSLSEVVRASEVNGSRDEWR